MYENNKYSMNNDDDDNFDNLVKNVLENSSIESTGELEHVHYAAGSLLVVTSAYFGFIMFVLRNAGLYIRMPFPTTFALFVVSIFWALYSMFNKEKAFAYYEKFFKYTFPAILALLFVLFPILLIVVLARILDFLSK